MPRIKFLKKKSKYRIVHNLFCVKQNLGLSLKWNCLSHYGRCKKNLFVIRQKVISEFWSFIRTFC